MTEAFPLQWPLGKRRSHPSRSRFKTTLSKAIAQVRSEEGRLGGFNLVISKNIPVRQDGFPYATHRKPVDRAAAV